LLKRETRSRFFKRPANNWAEIDAGEVEKVGEEITRQGKPRPSGDDKTRTDSFIYPLHVSRGVSRKDGNGTRYNHLMLHCPT